MSNSISHLVTHSGSFHADDVFSFTILSLLYPNARLVRTRNDLEAWAQNPTAILFDVGGACDHKRLFDHHQRDDSLQRPSGVLYSSAGLVWKAFGLQFIRAALPLCLPGYHISPDIELATWTRIDQAIVEPLDHNDTTGQSTSCTDIPHIVYCLNPRYPLLAEDDQERDYQFQAQFLLASQLLRTVLLNALRTYTAPLLAQQTLQAHYRTGTDPAVLVLPASLCSLPVDSFLSENPQILFVVKATSSKVSVTTTPIPGQHFSTKQCPLPSEWAGLSNNELAQVSGLASARFCHKNLYYACFGTLDDALAAVQIARNSAP